MLNNKFLAKSFLIIILTVVLYFCYLILKPFLMEFILSAMLVTIFYGVYKKLLIVFRNRRSLTAFIMCFLIILVVIIPLTNFLIYLSQKSIEAYFTVRQSLTSKEWQGYINDAITKFDFIDPQLFNFQEYLLQASGKAKDFIVTGGTSLVKSTTSFITSLLIVLFTMFFFFRDGERFLKKIMYLTPLSNKYDKIIFKKFKAVSFSSIASTFIAAIAQGIIGAVGFMIVGVPAFFAGVGMAVLALLPYIGAAFVWFPTAVYLLLTGRIWQGIFLLAWGLIMVSLSDNLLRTYIIKGKAEVPSFIIFLSIFGGLAAFGFWGVFLGPLIVAIAFTVIHIYEMEYKEVLEK